MLAGLEPRQDLDLVGVAPADADRAAGGVAAAGVEPGERIVTSDTGAFNKAAVINIQ